MKLTNWLENVLTNPQFLGGLVLMSAALLVLGELPKLEAMQIIGIAGVVIVGCQLMFGLEKGD